jgi:hypothetical protein
MDDEECRAVAGRLIVGSHDVQSNRLFVPRPATCAEGTGCPRMTRLTSLFAVWQDLGDWFKHASQVLAVGVDVRAVETSKEA